MSSFWKFFTGEEGEGNADGSREGPKTPGAPEAKERDLSMGPKEPKKISRPPPATKSGSTPPPPPDILPATPGMPGVASLSPGDPRDLPPRASRPPSSPEANMRYGIDDAIKLMRSLPVEENADLVVRVMKTTLESLKVRIGEIIEDATKRQDILKRKITDYQMQIAQFEREIDARKHEITRLDEELHETTKVKDRLQAAELMPLTPQTPSAAPKEPGHAGRSAPPLPMPRNKPVPPPPETPKRAGFPASSSPVYKDTDSDRVSDSALEPVESTKSPEKSS